MDWMDRTQIAILVTVSLRERHRAPAQGMGGHASESQPHSPLDPPPWVSGSALLTEAYSLAEEAHGAQRRPTDGRLFLEHVTEVAGLLQEAGFDDELVAVGLLHDSVERGRITEAELRSRMPDQIGSLVMTLSEDPEVEPFERRKEALRAQVAAAGGRAVTVFAADKLSDILGLRRGVEGSGDRIEERMGTTVTSMASHYRDSVEMIASVRPGSAFLPALRLELGRLQGAG